MFKSSKNHTAPSIGNFFKNPTDHMDSAAGKEPSKIGTFPERQPLDKNSPRTYGTFPRS